MDQDASLDNRPDGDGSDRREQLARLLTDLAERTGKRGLERQARILGTNRASLGRYKKIGRIKQENLIKILDHAEEAGLLRPGERAHFMALHRGDAQPTLASGDLPLAPDARPDEPSGRSRPRRRPSSLILGMTLFLAGGLVVAISAYFIGRGPGYSSARDTTQPPVPSSGQVPLSKAPSDAAVTPPGPETTASPRSAQPLPRQDTVPPSPPTATSRPSARSPEEPPAGRPCDRYIVTAQTLSVRDADGTGTGKYWTKGNVLKVLQRSGSHSRKYWYATSNNGFTGWVLPSTQWWRPLCGSDA